MGDFRAEARGHAAVHFVARLGQLLGQVHVRLGETVRVAKRERPCLVQDSINQAGPSTSDWTDHPRERRPGNWPPRPPCLGMRGMRLI